MFPHGVIERDSFGPLIDDVMVKGRAFFEIHHLKHPKVRSGTNNPHPLDDPKRWHKPPSVHGSLDTKGNYKYIVGEVTMRVVFLESWKSVLVNVKPNIVKKRSVNKKISFTEEFQRAKILVRRIKMLYNATLPIRRELDSLFNYDNPVWTVFVLFVLEYLAYYFPADKALAVIPWLGVLHMIVMRHQRRQAGFTRDFDRSLLALNDLENDVVRPNARVRVAIVAAHGLPFMDPGTFLCYLLT